MAGKRRPLTAVFADVFSSPKPAPAQGREWRHDAAGNRRLNDWLRPIDNARTVWHGAGLNPRKDNACGAEYP